MNDEKDFQLASKLGDSVLGAAQSVGGYLSSQFYGKIASTSGNFYWPGGEKILTKYFDTFCGLVAGAKS